MRDETVSDDLSRKWDHLLTLDIDIERKIDGHLFMFGLIAEMVMSGLWLMTMPRRRRAL